MLHLNQKFSIAFLDMIGRKFYENFSNISAENCFEIKGEGSTAKSAENSKSVGTGCSKFLSSYRFLDGKLDDLTTTVEFFGTRDANGKKQEPFKEKIF